MPKDILDIIDTAVKIGLGATIAGVTTYVLAVRNFKFDKLKEDIEQRRELIIEIANNFEKSNGGTNRFALTLRKYIRNDIGDKTKVVEECYQFLLDSVTHIEAATANANLLGLEELYSVFRKYTGLLNKFIDALDDLDQSKDNLQSLIEEGRELQISIYPLITKAYDEFTA